MSSDAKFVKFVVSKFHEELGKISSEHSTVWKIVYSLALLFINYNV